MHIGRRVSYLAPNMSSTREQHDEGSDRRPLPRGVDLWRSLGNAIPTGVGVVDADLRFVEVNSELSRINDLPVEEHLGRTVNEVFPGEQGEQLAAVFRSVMDTGEPVEGRLVSGEQPHSGVRKVVMANYFPVTDDDGGVVAAACSMIDLTERAALEESLQRANSRLRALIDGLFTFVGLLDRDGLVIDANRSALDAAGLVAADVEGHPFDEAYWWSHDPLVQQRLRDAIACGRQGEISRYDAVVRLKDEYLITIDFQLVPLFEVDEVTAMVVSGIDITERLEHQHQLEALAGLARALSAATTTQALAQVIVDPEFRAATGASFVNLGLVLDDGSGIEMVQPHDLGPELRAKYATVPMDAPVSTPTAVLQQRSIVLSGPDDENGLCSASWPDVVSAGFRVVASVPLHRSDGSVGGVLGLAWSDPVDPRNGVVRSRMNMVAEMVTQGLERTRSMDMRLQLIRSLQSELLPVVTSPAKLDLAVRYRAATSEIGIGGDWYETRQLDEHRTAVLVGDIAGHGVAAAAQMTQVRGLLNALLELGVADGALELGELFPRAAAVLARDGQQFLGTATIAVIDTLNRTVSWASAGHPPLVLCHRDGDAELLWGVRQLPLGLPTEPVLAPTAAFHAGDTLVAYTDGLIERPGESIDAGLGRLQDAVRRYRGSASDTMADGVLDVLLEPGEQRDDIALVVAVAS